jgi:hypothetical protein
LRYFLFFDGNICLRSQQMNMFSSFPMEKESWFWWKHSSSFSTNEHVFEFSSGKGKLENEKKTENKKEK